MSMEVVADWMPGGLDLSSLHLPPVLISDTGLPAGGGGGGSGGCRSAAAAPPSAPAALGSACSGGSSSSLDDLDALNAAAWSSLVEAPLPPSAFSPVTPLGDAPLAGAAAGGDAKCPAAAAVDRFWADTPTSVADLLSSCHPAVVPPGSAPVAAAAGGGGSTGGAPDALLRVDPDLLNATDRRQRRRRLRSLKHPRGRGGGWAPAVGGVTKSLASSPLPAPAGWTPAAAAGGATAAGSVGGRRPPSPRGAAAAPAAGGAGGGGASPAAAAAAADAAVDKKAARVIRNREVALKARQAAKEKAARLAADNAALTARVAELVAENAALLAATVSLRTQERGGEGAAGGDAPRNWA